MSAERRAGSPPIQPESVQVVPSAEIPAPQVAKTPLMLSVEQRFAAPGESIGELLARLYREEKTFVAVARHLCVDDFKVSRARVGIWMKALNPQIKIKRLAELRQDPQFEGYRISRARAYWQDPEKKKRTIEKRNQNPDYINRKQAFRDPEFGAEARKEGAKAQRRKARQTRMATLGKAPRKALRLMAEVQGLSVAEIAVKIGRNRDTVRRWLREYKIKAGRTPPERRRRPGITDTEIGQRREKIRMAKERGLFKYLSPRQQEVLSDLYLEQEVVPTLATVANRLRVTRENIRRLDKRGLAKLDRLLASKKTGKIASVDSN